MLKNRTHNFQLPSTSRKQQKTVFFQASFQLFNSCSSCADFETACSMVLFFCLFPLFCQFFLTAIETKYFMIEKNNSQISKNELFIICFCESIILICQAEIIINNLRYQKLKKERKKKYENES